MVLASLRRAVAFIALGLPVAALAQDLRVLESLELRDRGDAYELTIGFGVPIRYLRHAPAKRGSTLEVQIGTVSFGASGGPSLFGSESLRPSVRGLALIDVVYEGGRREGPAVVLHFSRPVDFEVGQEAGLRTLKVTVRDKRQLVAQQPSASPPQPPGAAQAPAPIPLPPPSPPAPSSGNSATGPQPSQPKATPAPEAKAPEVVAAEPAPQPPSAPPPRQADAAQAAKVDALVTTGRAALEGGDLDTALASLSQAVTLPEAPRSPEAKELLGVTRERRGQLAHAKAEYEEYLERYPEGEGAVRVRQRLDAMIAAQLAKLPASKGAAAVKPGGGRASAFHQYGSASISYRRYVHTADSVGSLPTDSSLQLDNTYVARGNAGDFAIRAQLAGAYRFDLLEGMDENDARISSVFVDLKQIEGSYNATLGRQPGNTAGVLSRFDGARLGRKLRQRWRLSLLGGLPVDYYDSLKIDTSRYVYGVALDAEGLFGGLTGQLFVVQQRASDLVDRTAIGAELRWTDETKFVSSYFDYDVDYTTLNTALVVASWRVASETNLNLMFDYRTSPILTTSNALVGQPVDSLEELRALFTNAEIRRLAEDRTPTSYYGSVGGTQQLTKRLQLGLDVAASRLTATPASGGVDATPATGWELAVSPQLIATGLLAKEDIATVGYRYFDGSTTTTHSLLLNERFPITSKLRMSPRLRLDWRRRVGSDEFVPPPGTEDDPFFRPDPIRSGQLTVRGYLGTEYRFWKLTLDSDCGVEWTDGAFTGETSLDYSLWFGARFDF